MIDALAAGWADERPLRGVASHCQLAAPALGVLDAFGDDGQAELCARSIVDRHDHIVLAVPLRPATNERSIFSSSAGRPAQVAQRRVAGAEVVDDERGRRARAAASGKSIERAGRTSGCSR
jgi:hypothetical protein